MMKKLACLLPACFLTLLVVSLAAGGGAEDPLASLSYLLGSFTREVDRQVEARLDASDQFLQGNAGETPSGQSTATWMETRLKQGDALQGSTGTSAILLAGSGQIVYASGAVVDVTAGREIASGTGLVPNHRYLVAEDTAAKFLVTSKTAVLDYQGNDSFSYSNAVDYNAMASALKSMHLFRGSFTGYGQGFDLELAPTRLQALIMFIRVLGEEEQALAWQGTTPFTDLSKGSEAEKYVGYACEKGYTNGYSPTQFKPGKTVNVNQYTEFILRAMGYSSVDHTDLSDTLLRAEQAGVLTSGEVSVLGSNRFLRADLVYLSYYALEALLPDGTQTLADSLMTKGVFTASEWKSSRGLVTSPRM